MLIDIIIWIIWIDKLDDVIRCPQPNSTEFTTIYGDKTGNWIHVRLWSYKILSILVGSSCTTKPPLCNGFSFSFPEPSPVTKTGPSSEVQTDISFIHTPHRSWLQETFWAASSWPLCSSCQMQGWWRKSYGIDDRLWVHLKNITWPSPVLAILSFSTTSITSMFLPVPCARWTWTHQTVHICSPRMQQSPPTITPLSTPWMGRTRSSSPIASTYHGRPVAVLKTCPVWKTSWVGWRCSKEKSQLWGISATVTRPAAAHRPQVALLCHVNIPTLLYSKIILLLKC